MSRYQPQRDRFGRPLNPNDRDRFNRNPQGPIQQPRGPQGPIQPNRGPQGPIQPNRGPQQPDQSGRPPQYNGGGFNGGRNDDRGNGPQRPFGNSGRGPGFRGGFRGPRHRGRHWRGRGGGPQGPHRNEPPPIPKDQLTQDPDAFWMAGRDLDLLTDTTPPTPGITLRRLGASPFGEHAAAVELTLRRTWVASTTAAAALLRR